MERYDAVPSAHGPAPVRVAFLASPGDWRQLLDDADWDRLVEQERRRFGLLTVSADPEPEKTAWMELADHLVARECVLTCSWGIGSSLLDDLVDESAVLRSVVHGLPSAEPLTTWHDDEPLVDALKFFLEQSGHDLRDQSGPWERFVLVVGEQNWLHEVRSLLSSPAAPSRRSRRRPQRRG